MRKTLKSVFFAIIIAVFSVAAIGADPLTDGIYTRERMMAPYRDEIASASYSEVSADSIGEWYDILESSLFMIIRRTEIFRGTMRLIITNQQEARCFLYPDGTFLISTGMFDYIDSYLFEAISVSARRIRNFNTEREHFLAPITALCAAQFALNEYGYDGKNLAAEKIYTIDVLANVLLDIAGYPRHVLESWLSHLDKIATDSASASRFKVFLPKEVTPAQRIEQLYANEEAGINLYEELSGVLFALHNRKGTLDARNALEGLKLLFPNSLYISRLYALITHQAWLNTLNKKTQELATILPAAVYDTSEVYPFFQALDTMNDREDEQPEEYFLRTMPNKESNKLYDYSRRAYRDYLSSIYEAGMASSYACLLASSPLAHERAAVLAIAKQADVFHADTSDRTARVNYATLLCIIAKDFTKARLLIADCLDAVQHEKQHRKLFLTTGFPVDERLMRCNYIRILHYLNDADTIIKEKQQLAPLFVDRIMGTPDDSSAIKIRDVSLGVTVDELLHAWDKPSFIIYNYYSERWIYRLFNTEAVIRSKDKGGIVSQLTINYPSPLSFFNAVRTGDPRDSFEKICGSPLYYSADSAVYFKNGTILQVVYANNKIRNITLRKYQ